MLSPWQARKLKRLIKNFKYEVLMMQPMSDDDEKALFKYIEKLKEDHRIMKIIKGISPL